MPSLSRTELFQVLVGAVGDAAIVERSTYLPYKMMILKTKEKYAIYIWNLLESGQTSKKRPRDEYKINLRIGELDYSSDYFPIIMAYSPEFKIFLLWDGTRYHPTSGTRNVQIKYDSVLEASAMGQSHQYIMTQYGMQKVLLGESKYLLDMISERREVYIEELIAGKPISKIEKLPRHGNYAQVYEYVVNHMDYTTFEISRALDMSVRSVANILNILYINKDVPRTFLCSEEISLIQGKIKEHLHNGGKITYTALNEKFALPKWFIDKYIFVKIDRYY